MRTPRILKTLLPLALAATALAQTQPDATQTVSLVTPTGPGRILIAASNDLQLSAFHLFDKNTRPAMQFLNRPAGLAISYFLFPNPTGTPTAEACRDAVIKPIIQGFPASFVVSAKKTDTTHTTPAGTAIPTASYLVETANGQPIRQQNLYGFYGDATTCAEAQISKSNFQPSEESLLTTELDRFHFEPGYIPSSRDYFLLASIFYTTLKNPAAAIPYYQSALATLPTDPRTLKVRRIITDQIAMSYGMTGNILQSRAILKKSIAEDPDYPLYYYNLACADAEEGDAANAKLHLQQAFARKANTLPNENMPDPTKDESILKLKNNEPFWTFVQTLSK